MADLALSVLVDRTSLGLGALELQATGTYRITDLGPGGQVLSRRTVGSPYVKGRMLVSAVPDTQIATIGVRVFASTQSALWSRVGTLLAAFSQFSYTVTVTLESQVFTWRCEPADYSVGREQGMVDPYGVRALQQEVHFSVPRDPVAAAGVL